MRIAIFTDTYKPQVNGVVTVVETLKEGLEKRGHEVFIFTVSHPGAVKEKNVFRLKSVKFSGDPQHRIGIFPDPRVIVKLKSNRIDVVHTHTPFVVGYTGVLYAKFLKIPLVHTYHTHFEEYVHYMGLLRIFLRKPLIRKVGKFFCDLHDIVVAPSVKIEKILKSYGVRVPIVHVPNGIDLSPFWNFEGDLESFKERFGIKDEKIVLFVGRLGKEKNVGKVIENFKKVKDELKNVKLLLVGDGPESENLEKLSERLNLKDSVVFTGYLKWPEEVSMAYHVSDIFVSASKSEVHPITFIEAIASGLPVVAFKDPSLEGVVEDGVNGFLFENENDLHKGIVKVLRDEDLRKDFSRKSKEISLDFSMDRFVENMEELYSSLNPVPALRNFSE